MLKTTPKESIRTMKKQLALILVVLSVIGSIPANAIENGQSAAGNGVVVDIAIKYNATQSISCSGALLSSLVVVTAGHCLLDQSGAIASEIYVSLPGASALVFKNWTLVKKVYLPEDYEGEKLGGFVNTSDLGFLLLTTPIEVKTPISLASEKQLLNLKANGTKLRVLGYGTTTDEGMKAEFPNYFDGAFSPQVYSDSNQGSVSSASGNVCKGDSGGPVLYITPTKVILVGILTGTQLSVNCSKKWADGKYYATFTIINRFANLAALALTEAAGAIELQKNNEISRLQEDLDNANGEFEELLQRSNDYQTEIEQLKLDIARYKASGLKLLTCSKGLAEKVVAGISPKCPAGFKVKK